MDRKLCVGMDLSGRDFSESDISNTVFMNCNMEGVKFPTTLWEMRGAVFIDCYFDTIYHGERFIAPLYNAKYRFRKRYLVKWETDGDMTDCVSFSSDNLVPAVDPKELGCIYDNFRNFYDGYKLLTVDNKYVVAELRIGIDTPAVLFPGCKCRAERVFVKSISDFYGKQYNKAMNVCYDDKKCLYEVGKEVIADEWDPDIMVGCTHGIHFFLTQQEAWGFSLYLG